MVSCPKYHGESADRDRQVQFMSTLPLKAMSRLWGKFNELDIPYYLRVPGFLLYSKIFGVKYV
jgi:phosphatidylserine decarboxylase